jgi:uncharacterized protein (TIGR02246 family)
LPFADKTFDVVTGFNSFQYAGNPVVALKEARRVTKADGYIAIVTWGQPDGMEAAGAVTALRPLMPPPPPGAAGPFALSDQTALRTFAADAGLTRAEVFDVENPFVYPDEATAVRGWNSAGVAARAMENSSEQAVTEAHANRPIPAIGRKLSPACHLPVLAGPGGVIFLTSAAFVDKPTEATDEAAIRHLVETWMAASKAGDIATVLDLMTDDVIFMVPGREPFGKPAFATASDAMKNVRIDGKADIRELKVLGDWAYIRNYLEMTITSDGGEPVKRSGWTLTILRKEEGRWRLARDANLVM